VDEILSAVGLKYRQIDPYYCDLKQYIGRYRWQNGSEQDVWTIDYDDDNQFLYTSLFWPTMTMRCIQEDVFELISFPVEMHFQHNQGTLQFRVHGNYDWEYNNQLFIRI
jgi:hypothetical protein